MSFRTIEWTSYQRLSCSGCTPADVIICLTDPDEGDPDKITSRDCPLEGAPPEVTAETVFDWHHIEGQLVNVTTIRNKCGGSFYRYVIAYDDVQLVTGTNLTAADIANVVCKGCLTTYIEDKAGNDVKVEEVTPGTFTLTNQHGCQYQFGITSGGCPITQMAHGFIMPMQGVIPVVYDNDSALWVLAQADEDANLADAVIYRIVDSNTFLVMTQGDLFVENHGLDIGYYYALSPDVAGGVIRSDLLTDCAQILQRILFVKNDDCLQVGLLPGVDVCDYCCAIQEDHGFELPANGVFPVYLDSYDATYKPAQADSPDTLALFLIIDIPFTDTLCPAVPGFNFTVHGLDLNTTYALSPDTAGEVVPISEVETGYVQALFTTITDDCIYVNICCVGEGVI